MCYAHTLQSYDFFSEGYLFFCAELTRQQKISPERTLSHDEWRGLGSHDVKLLYYPLIDLLHYRTTLQFAPSSEGYSARYSASFALHSSGMGTVCCNSKSKATITDELSVSSRSPHMIR